MSKKNHSEKFEKVQRYYVQRLWTKQMVRNAVAKDWISTSEYGEITGEVYA
jgi:hypothetical protein